MRIALIQQFAHHDKGEHTRKGLEVMSNTADEGAEVVVFAEVAATERMTMAAAEAVLMLMPPEER